MGILGNDNPTIQFKRDSGARRTCRVATQANLAALTALAADAAGFDGVTLAAGERILLRNQTAAATNGVYVAVAGSGETLDLVRAPDADAAADVFSGLLVAVTEGTDAGKLFCLTTVDPIVLGTTALTFAAIGDTGAAADIAAALAAAVAAQAAAEGAQETADAAVVGGEGGDAIVVLANQAAYDALDPVMATTVYMVPEE